MMTISGDRRAPIFGFLLLLYFGGALSAASQPRCDRIGDLGIVGDISAMHGFARLAGTTGGKDQPIFKVTSTDDEVSNPPPNTLRYAIEQARRHGGGTVVFELPCQSAHTIALKKQIILPGNLTIDGIQRAVKISAPMNEAIFRIEGSENIIIRRLILTKEKTCLVIKEGAGKCSRQADIISILDKSDRIWIAENDFSECGDGCIDAMFRNPANSSTHITVSFNRMYDHNKVMLFGVLGCSAERAATSDCQLAGTSRLMVTLERNLYQRTAQRHPRISGAVYVHSVGNVGLLKSYKASAETRASGMHGIASLAGGRVLSESDYFSHDVLGKTVRGTFGNFERRSGEQDDIPREKEGAIRLKGSFGSPNLTMMENQPQAVPDPPYRAPPSPGLTSAADGERYARCLQQAMQASARAAAALQCGGKQ